MDKLSLKLTIVTIQVQSPKSKVLSPKLKIRKSGTLSSTDPTSYLEDRVILDKVPDVQLSSKFLH